MAGTILTLLVVLNSLTSTVSAICPGVSDHADNPLTQSCSSSTVTWESEVTTSLVGANGTQYDYTDLVLRAKTTTGGCIRNCGSIASTETDPVSGEATTRSLDVMSHPPVFVYSSTVGGFTMERTHTFTGPTCDLAASDISKSTGVEYKTVYQNNLEAALGATESRRRRLGAAENGRRLSEDAASMPLHPSVAARLQAEVSADLAFHRKLAVLTGASSPSARAKRSTLSQLFDPANRMFTSHRNATYDAATIMKSLPSIDPDVMEAAQSDLLAGMPEGTKPEALSPEVVFRLAMAIQQSRMAYLDEEDGADGPHRTNPRSLWDDHMDNMEEWHTPESGMVALAGMSNHPARKRKLAAGVVLAAAALAVGGAALVMASINMDAINNEIMPALDDLKGSVKATQDTLESMNKALEGTQEIALQSQRALESMAGTVESLQSGQAAILDATTMNAEEIKALQETQIAFQASVDGSFSQAAAERAGLAQDIADATTAFTSALTELGLSTGAEIDLVATQSLDRDIAIQDRFNNITETQATNLEHLEAKLKIVSRKLLDLTAAVYDFKMRRPARRRVTRLANLMWNMVSDFHWSPFLRASTLAPGGRVDADPDTWWLPGSPRRRLHIDTISVYTVRRATGFVSDVYDGGRNHALREDVLDLYCDAAYLQTNAMPWWTADDIIQLIGPDDGCAVPDAVPAGDNPYAAWVDADGAENWNPGGAPACRCWVEASASACDIPLTSPTDRAITGTSSSPNSTKYLSKSGLTPQAPLDYDPCVGVAAVDIPAATRVIRSWDAFTSTLQDLCSPEDGRDVSSVSAPSFQWGGDMAASDVPLSTSYITSSRLSGANPDPGFVYMLTLGNVGADECGADTTSISSASHLTLPRAVNHFIMQGWSLAFDDLKQGDMDRYGSIPSEIRVTERPFNIDIESASTFTCHDVEFAATQGSMVPVYRWRPEGGPQKRFEVWMAPVAPSEPGATDGRPAVHYTTSDPEMVLDTAHLLPEDSIFVGKPMCMFQECPHPAVGEYANGTGLPNIRYLYDIPQNELSLSPDPTLRVGKATYLLHHDTTTDENGDFLALDSAYDYTLDVWETEHPGEAFDVDAAGTDISTYLRQVVQTPGGEGPGDVTCLADSGVADGPLCTMLEHYYFLVPSLDGVHSYLAGTPAAACADPSSGTVCLVPRDVDMVAQARVPVGTITQSVGSVCPRVSDELLTQSGIPTLTLSNDADVPVEFKYDWTFRGPNGELDNPVANETWNIMKTEAEDAGDPVPPHPCYTQDRTDQDGGIIAPGSTTNLQSTISAGVALCAQWALTLYIQDPATSMWTACHQRDITINLASSVRAGDGLTFYSPITIPITEDTESLNRLTSVGDGMSSVLTDRDMKIRYLMALAPGGITGYNTFTSNLTHYQAPPTLSSLTANFTDTAEDIIARDEERSAEAEGAIAELETRAVTFDEAQALALEAAEAVLAETEERLEITRAHLWVLNETIIEQEERLREANETMWELFRVNEAFLAREFDGVRTSFHDIVDGAVDGVVGLANGAADAAEEVKDLITGPLLDLFGGIGNLVTIIFVVGIVILLLWVASKLGLFDNCCKGTRNKYGSVSPFEVQMLINQELDRRNLTGTPSKPSSASPNGGNIVKMGAPARRSVRTSRSGKTTSTRRKERSHAKISAIAKERKHDGHMYSKV